MKRWTLFLAVSLLLSLYGCQSRGNPCKQAGVTPVFLSVAPGELPTPASEPAAGPIQIKIGGRNVWVNKVVEGPLCNDSWSGTVYVTCNVQIYPWVEKPLFLENCQLEIAPDTVVYVAQHNDAAYYKGCSCHTGELELP